MGKTRKPRHVFAGTTRLTRLGPDDGITKHPDERGLRTHDRSGQALKDVVDPRTGFCTGVTGPLESEHGITRAAKPTSGAGTPLPERDETTGLWWVGNDRLVVRTTTTPDGPLRRTRLVKNADLDEAGRTPEERKPAKKPVDARQRASLDKRKGPRYSDTEIRNWIKKHTGYTGPLTRKIRTSAIDCMIKAATVAEYQADLTAARKRR